MTSTVSSYRFSRDEFVRAWDAGVFDHRVELIEGEVWPVVIGGWHGRMVGRVIGTLHRLSEDVTAETLPSGSSLPDPDCWVLRAGAEPIGSVGRTMSVWQPEDVLLVVEVSDETVMADLTTKARIYGSAGWPVYWVITQDVIYEHTEPKGGGYASRREYGRGEQIPVRHAGTDLAVQDLLGPATS